MKKVSIFLSSKLAKQAQGADCAEIAKPLHAAMRFPSQLTGYFIAFFAETELFEDYPPDLWRYFTIGNPTNAYMHEAYQKCSRIEIHLSCHRQSQLWMKIFFWPSGKRGERPLWELLCHVDATGRIE